MAAMSNNAAAVIQGKLLEMEDFLLAPAGGERDHAFTGRSHRQ